MIGTWQDITFGALTTMWQGFILSLPKLIGAIFIFTIGLFLSSAVGRLIAEVLRRFKLNHVFERTGWKEALEKADLKVDPSGFIGGVCKWILVIVSLQLAVGILEFEGFVEILDRLISWLPKLIIAVAIFIVAIILTDILEKVIKASVKKMGVDHAGFLGALVRWTIYILAVLAISEQLLDSTIINTLFSGFVAMMALAFGLAFGLGGKEAAARAIEEFRKKVS
jgi:hypothetical protein